MNEILVCSSCGREYSPDEKFFRCPSCSSYFNLKLDGLKFDPSDLNSRSGSGIWRYRSVIPVKNDKNIVSFSEEKTPLADYSSDSGELLIKLDYLFTSGSYKDRGAAVLVSKVKELMVDYVVEDSSGNAGASVAAYCARGGIGCSIYVPASNSEAKLSQIKSYGADLVAVEGSRAETSKRILGEAEKYYYASHIWNPYFYHGTKTFSYEVCEQLGWEAPDTVVLPVGHGTLFLGSYIGFSELYNLGIIKKIPKFIAVQAENCSPVYRKWNDLNDADADANAAVSDTVAEGIAITAPVRINDIISVLKKTGGDVITVSEKEIEDTLFKLIGKGFYTEPTSAAAIAGSEKYLKSLKDSAQGDGPGPGKTVTVLTGSGLKASSKIFKLFSEKDK
jgi:threonine synthase